MFHKTLFISLFLGAVIVFGSFTAEDITQKISRYLKAGDAESLSELFNDNIRLKIEKNDHIYSRNQAKVILNDFFARNKPYDYKITSVRKTGSTNIIIGNLNTSERSFRIYYQLSDSGGKRLINYFDIQSVINSTLTD